MDATVLGYQAHQPDESYPRKTFMDYFTLLLSLILLAIPIGFVLLHLAICADIYIQARERRRTRDEYRARQAREGQDQDVEEQEQDLEQNLGGSGDPIRRDWYYGATESSHLLPAIHELDAADLE
ncbi:hypothetical protein PG985_012734 [Apiospora marii]|uniref:Uncharacterized protein n=1 Tax=Apiospora marii TaxID=335849 RepID=A0ABR1RCL8_9PEZI